MLPIHDTGECLIYTNKRKDGDIYDTKDKDNNSSTGESDACIHGYSMRIQD